MLLNWSPAADHNDPNAVNSIFSDIDVSAADLYDLFGWPSDDTSGGEKVVIALTFASVPKAGVLDPDMLYRIKLYASPRAAPPLKDDHSLEALLKYFEAVKEKYLHMKPGEVRVKVDQAGHAKIDFIDFPSGTFSNTIDTNKPVSVQAGGATIKVFVGGRDDAFFNDLPGFFRSINYAPQFYHVPHTMTDVRELPIPKTLIELEGNKLFNFDPVNPKHGQGVKLDLPKGPLTWSGKSYHKDANGNYRFVYSGKDAQAGKNINAIILEIPLAFITQSPQNDRIVNAWGESWVLKASHKVATIPDDRRPFMSRLTGWFTGLFSSKTGFEEELGQYKLVDTDGQAFADAALNEREDERQIGGNNFWLAPHFVTRLAHLGWGFGPSITALGLRTSFDHDNSPISVKPDLRFPDSRFSTSEESYFSGAQHARQQVEQEGAQDSAAALVRDLRAQRQLHRHGHDRHLALRQAAGRSGRDALPLAVSRHGSRDQWEEIQHRHARRSELVGQGKDRAQDAAESAQERQAVPQAVSISG